MSTAFSTWDGRIAPVFDAAQRVLIVESEAGRIVRASEEDLCGEIPARKALRLKERGVKTLVCGAISRPMKIMIEACGIQVSPFVSGCLEEVVQAWLAGRLERNRFLMPGCCGRRRAGRMGGPRVNLKEDLMKDGNLGNGMGGGGRGQGGGGGGGPVVGVFVGNGELPTLTGTSVTLGTPGGVGAGGGSGNGGAVGLAKDIYRLK